jgi:DUF4097 and DUF4098 domain-containing protein YvlB
MGLQPQGGSFDRILNVNGTADLTVETHAGAITVRSGETSAVRIHATIRVNHERAAADLAERIHGIESNPPIQQTGNTIRIARIEDESLRRQLSISYEINMPAAGNLHARTGSGSLNIEGIHGPVDASSGSGHITAAHIGGEVRIRTGSGAMTLDSIQGKLQAETGSGSIEARAITGPSTLETGSGAVRLEQTVAGPVKARTGSGGIEVRLPGAGGFDLHARTGSGRVSVSQPITVSGSMDKREIRGQIRGGGPLVDVSTGSGAIKIE